MRPRLRLFVGEEQGGIVAEPPVTVTLGEICKLLTDAVRSDRTWLTDFRDDEVQISADLYEVLSTYVHLRPSA